MIATASTPLNVTATRSGPARPSPDPGAVDTALTALATYNHGAGRAILVPLDEAVVSSLTDPSARTALEQRLISALEKRPSPVASEYTCGKLALIGTKAAVPVLTALLADPERGEPARNALELMPCPEAVHALRASLSLLTGSARMGVVQSLGIRRDSLSVPELCLDLHSPEPGLAAAAASALGRIGTVSAANALRASLSKAPDNVRSVVADACLICAETLETEQQPAEARQLFSAVNDANVPPHMRFAAQQALTKLKSS
jgi:HEAT repeat protein